MPRNLPLVALSASRLLVGGGSLVAPVATGRLFGLGRVNDDPRSAFVSRLFGSRDAVLGSALHHPSSDVRRAAIGLNIVVDAIDVCSSVLALRRGVPRAGVVLGGGGAALLVLLGVLALRQEEGGSAADTARPAGSIFAA